MKQFIMTYGEKVVILFLLVIAILLITKPIVANKFPFKSVYEYANWMYFCDAAVEICTILLCIWIFICIVIPAI